MRTATTGSPTQREPELLGQTVVVIGGSAGIALETERRAARAGLAEKERAAFDSLHTLSEKTAIREAYLKASTDTIV